MFDKVLHNLIKLRREALDALEISIDKSKIQFLIEQINTLKGKIIITGLGKSGLIGGKIASSICSIGIPAIFLHSNEALHGDLGVISKEDLVIFLSNSGEGREIHYLLDYCNKRNIYTVGLSSQEDSTLSRNSQLSFVLPKISEASYLKIPTTSSSMMLFWGDLITLLLIEARQTNHDDYLQLHPAGTIGLMRKKVLDVMIGINDLPQVAQDADYHNLIRVFFISDRPLLVVENTGLIFKADLLQANENIIANDIMKIPLQVDQNQYLGDIMNLLMTERVLFVIAANKVIGIINYDFFN
jgi:arabinose-5-phosphate isomerase